MRYKQNHKEKRRLTTVSPWLFLALTAGLNITPLAANSDSATAPIGQTEPLRGEVMASVEARLGQPQEKLPATGEPPIIRWVYKDFTVYFENEYVIHSTSNQLTPRKQSPK